MNALAAEFGFVAAPFLSVDVHPLQVNFYHPWHLCLFFMTSAKEEVSKISELMTFRRDSSRMHDALGS